MEDALEILKQIDCLFGEEDHIKELTVAERVDGFPTLFYASLSFPMLLTERDNVFKLNIKRFDENKILVMIYSVDHPLFPVREDRVRINGQQFTYLEQIGPDTKESNYEMIDLKGFIPTVIVN